MQLFSLGQGPVSPWSIVPPCPRVLQMLPTMSDRGLGHFGRGHLGRGHYGRGHFGRGHLGRGHYGRGHFGRGHLGRGHYGRGHLGRGHYGRGHLGRGHFGPLIQRILYCYGNILWPLNIISSQVSQLSHSYSYPTLLEALATPWDSRQQCSMGTLSLVPRRKVASSGPP